MERDARHQKNSLIVASLCKGRRFLFFCSLAALLIYSPLNAGICCSKPAAGPADVKPTPIELQIQAKIELSAHDHVLTQEEIKYQHEIKRMHEIHTQVKDMTVFDLVRYNNPRNIDATTQNLVTPDEWKWFRFLVNLRYANNRAVCTQIEAEFKALKEDD